MVAFALLILLIIVIIAVASIIYLLFYRHRINRQLNDETVRTRRLLSPLAFTIIVSFVVLIAGFAITLALRGSYSSNESSRPPQEYFDAIYDFDVYSPDEMTGYRSLYSIYENKGYMKSVSQQGDIRFTYFISDEAFDFFHPAFIIYAEYTGDKEILYSGWMGNFYTPQDINLGGVGGAGSEFSEYICFIGTSSIQSRFELNVYLYDSTQKSENMDDYSVASETISVWVK
jgi:hypothetical protein